MPRYKIVVVVRSPPLDDSFDTSIEAETAEEALAKAEKLGWIPRFEAQLEHEPTNP